MSIRERFQQEVYDAWVRSDMSQISAGAISRFREIFRNYADGFKAIKDKQPDGCFNEWDRKRAGQDLPSNIRRGEDFTRKMLAYCRSEDGPRVGEMRFIDPGGGVPALSLIARELTLGIPAQDNRFKSGSVGKVKPDGLAVVKADSSLAVVEVKGPDDNYSDRELDPERPIGQALCGFLAVYAKRNDILALCRHSDPSLRLLRRPISDADVSTVKPLKCILLLDHETPFWGPQKQGLRDRVGRFAKCCLEACHQEQMAISSIGVIRVDWEWENKLRFSQRFHSDKHLWVVHNDSS